MNNDMVRDIRHEEDGGAPLTVIELRDGSCLAISAVLLRYARDRAALADPFGNGVRGTLEIPPALAPRWEAGRGYLQEQAGGAVILNGDTTVLVKPFAIELYAAPLDALHARDCRGSIALG